MSGFAVAVRSPRRSHTWAAVVAAGGYAAALAWGMTHTSYDVWGALVVAPVLVAAAMPLLRRAAREAADPRLGRFLVVVLLLKLGAAVVRYAMGEEVYDGVADASSYIEHGARLAESFRHGDFTVDLQFQFVGTGFVRALTGLVFSVTGPTAIGGFLVFSWLGFFGLYAFYRAFCTGFPQGDHRRYGLLVFLLPSLLYWPSSIGKEAWMLFTLGLCALGVARLLARGQRGWLLLALGLAGTACVRPHMTALVCAGLGVAYVLRRSERRTVLGPVYRVVGLLLIVAVSAVVLLQVERFFGVEEEGATKGVDRVLEETAAQTNQGGSSFAATRVRSPVQLPAAVVSVLFRPFPFEAHNAQALVVALEGSALLALFVMEWRRLKAAPRQIWRNPYLAFAAVYMLLFVVAFSTFGNFGILSRQRVQVFPLVLVFLAVPFSVPPPSLRRARNY